MAEPLEAQYFGEYVTYSEIFGRKPTLAEFQAVVGAIGLHSLIACLSFINTVLAVKGTLAAQRDLVSSTFPPDIKARIARLPRLETRAVYSPAQLLFVMKTAVLKSPDRNDDRTDESFGRAMNEALLMANDLIDAELTAAIESADDSVEVTKLLLSHSVRSTMINAAEAYDAALARASILFNQVAARADVQQRAGPVAFDVNNRFTAVTGMSLEDYFSLGWMVTHWFALGARHPEKCGDNRSINPKTFFSQTRLDPSVGAALLARLTTDLSALKASIEQRAATSRLFAYDVVPFMVHPLYQVKDGVLVPPNLSFLSERLSTGVYWILFDAMNAKEREGWSAFFGHVLEAYVLDVVARSFGSGLPSPCQILPDALYRVGKQEMRTSDVIVLYPDEAIFFEVTATRMRMEATRVVESPAAVEEDLRKIVLKKAKQLNDRIDHFRQGHYSLAGRTAAQIATILPVIVTGEPVPMWTTTAISIRTELEAAGLLRQEGVGPLRVICVDEIELLEVLAAQGVMPKDVLLRHANDPEFRNVSLRNYLQRNYSIQPNTTLRAEYLRIGNNAAQLLFGTNLGPPDA